MQKWILMVVLCALILPVTLMAQSGKLSGKVTDRETGEPLIGANVKIEGTDRGAATNINGEYVILNVPIGKATLIASYVSYQTITIRDVLVRSNETTMRDFQLPSDAVKLDVKEIYAERPLIDKNVTNSKQTVTSDEIENLPVRGVENIAAVQAGVTNIGGTLYMRGSRGDETGYIVDGMTVNNPLYGGRSVTVISNSIDEMSVQTGGYSAEFGMANGGLVNTVTKTGGRKLQVSFEAYSDALQYHGWDKSGLPRYYNSSDGQYYTNYDAASNQFSGAASWDSGDRTKFLGNYSAGFSNYQLTVGGPVIGPVKFFIAAQNQFARHGNDYDQPITLTQKWDALLRNSSAHSLLSPEEQRKVGLFDPQLGASAKKGDFTWPGGGYNLNQASQNSALTGNLTFDLNPINVRVGGSYAYGYSRAGSGMQTTLSEARARVNESENYSINMKLSHLLSTTTMYELYLNYVGNFGIQYDPDLQHNIFAYGDSIANKQYGYQYRANDLLPLSYTVFGSTFYPAGYPLTTGYAKTRYDKISGRLNFVHAIGRTHEIKLGGEADQFTIRNYAINAASLWSFLRSNPDATAEQVAFNARSDYYGYDQWGRKLDTGEDGPKHPVFAGAYVLDKIELEDLVINLGLRYDYIDTDSKVPLDIHNIKFLADGNLDPTGLVPAAVSQTVSPRIGFSFPVTDQTRFFAQYGRFVQQSRLRDVYLGNAVNASNIRGGYAIQSPVGFGLRPENTIQYDFGFQQQLGDNLVINIQAFYKDIRDLIQIRQITGSPGAQHLAYYAYVNGDFATSAGVTLKATLRRVERLMCSIDYTYQNANGTGSNSSGSFFAIWQSPTETPYYPKIVQTLDQDQTHKGTISLDYRFGKDDGPSIGNIRFLERTGLNMLFQFTSGLPYTRVDEFSFGNRHQPIESINSSTRPWFFQLDGRLDKSVTIADLNFNFYIWVSNLLNTKNVTGVYGTSGSNTDDGYLSTEEGMQKLASYRVYGQVFEDAYRDYYYQMNLMNAGWGSPRVFYFGVRIDF
jgi:hypothetical protein